MPPRLTVAVIRLEEVFGTHARGANNHKSSGLRFIPTIQSCSEGGVGAAVKKEESVEDRLKTRSYIVYEFHTTVY